MLFETDSGKILTEDDINNMSVLDIETQGVHGINHWQDWENA